MRIELVVAVVVHVLLDVLLERFGRFFQCATAMFERIGSHVHGHFERDLLNAIQVRVNAAFVQLFSQNLVRQRLYIFCFVLLYLFILFYLYFIVILSTSAATRKNSSVTRFTSQATQAKPTAGKM